MGRRASQTSCQTCRERHLKCDSQAEPCLNCTKSHRECKRSSWFMFRPVSPPTASGNGLRKRRSVLPASERLSQQDKSPGSPEQQVLALAPGLDANEAHGLYHPLTSSSTEDHDYDRSPLPALASEWTAEDIFTTRSRASPFHQEDYPQVESAVLSREKLLLLGDGTAQTQRVQLIGTEARLIRYFIQVWGPLLDATDDTRQFSTSIPYLAYTAAPCLLYAILALAALQLSCIGDVSPHTALFYRKKCAQVLVPILLTDPNSVHEASIFATYVLLRTYDHLTVVLSERPPESLFSQGLALSTQPWNAYSDKAPLKRAAFWVHLRQDIHTALMLECAVQVDHTLYEQTVAVAMQITEQDLAARNALHGHARHSSPEKDLSPTSDIRVECAWTNRLSIQDWTSLLVELESWNINKPEAFRPFLELAPEPEKGRPFPDIHLQNDWHVLGLLYYHMSLVLLKSWKPGQLCKNKDLRTVDYNTSEEILHHARQLCGVAASNPTQPSLLIAVPMINIAACFFSDKASQNGVVEILELAGKTTGMRSDRIAERLIQEWKCLREDG